MTKADRVKEAMTDGTDTTMEDELNAVLAGSNPLENLSLAQTGPLHYTVLSARNGGVTAHRVNIQSLTCSCEDMTYNKNLSSDADEGREVCAHIAFALMNHPQLDAGESAIYQSMGLMEEAASLRDQLDTQLDRFENALVELRSANANATAEIAETTTETTQSTSGQAKAEEKAEQLQAAYDAVVDDMGVQAHEGYVWVQTGKDTPDTLPGPGNVEVFQAFLQNADAVEYIHDDHDAMSQKPGEWWKNRIDPDDVDDYIAEVLE